MEDHDDNLNIQHDDIDNALLQNLKVRFNRDVIYTFTGKLLIAINPMKNVDLYSEKIMMAYQLQPRVSVSPHIYSIGTDAFNAINEENKPQCVIITGESGSGKTVTTQHLAQFLCNTSPNREYIMKRASITMKLLNIFGNAETPENRNSSRFVKLLQINYSSKNEATNIRISYQLLEISRLCGQTTFGFNFHVFYLLAFHAPINLKKRLGLENQQFRILSAADSNHPYQYGFDELDQSLNLMGLTENVKNSMYSVLAAILHLCNLEFHEDSSQNAKISDDAPLSTVARLLALDPEELRNVLISREFKTRAENLPISMPLNRSDAMRMRDSMVKSFYKQLFQYLIDVINKGVSEPFNSKYIAILDIAGFECRVEGNNCFEQICINYVNEVVQQFCIRKLIKDKLEWYAIDGINIPEVKLLDNANILDLFEHKTDGMWSLLEDESKKRSPSNLSFFENIKAKCSRNPAFIIPKLSSPASNSFVIKHFSKDVSYSSNNFVEKNSQFTPKNIFDVIKKCLGKFIDDDKLNQPNESRSVTNSLRKDLGKLMTTLDENGAHFVRCIKPNKSGIDSSFDDIFIKNQLKANSIVPYMNLMQKGYPNRTSYTKLLPSIEIYLSKDIISNQKELAEHLMLAIGCEKNDFTLGESQIFFRPGKINLLYQYNMSDPAVIKDLASKIENQMNIEIQQREAKILSDANKMKPMSEETPTEKIQQINLTEESMKNDACSNLKNSQSVKNHEEPPKPLQNESGNGIKHMPYKDDNKSGSRCKFPKCKYFTHVFCKDCNKHFCFTQKRNCFATYHTNWL